MKIIRWAFMAAVFISGMFHKDTELLTKGSSGEFNAIFFFGALLLLSISGLIVLIAFRGIMGWVANSSLFDEYWEIPNQSKNPFNLKQPLIFMNFLGYLILSFALGIIASALWRGWEYILIGFHMIVMGTAVFWVIRLSIKDYSYKFKEEAEDT